MNEKLIITNKTDLPMSDVTLMASQVVNTNNIPDKVGELWIVRLSMENIDYVCVSKRNRKSATLTFVKE